VSGSLGRRNGVLVTISESVPVARLAARAGRETGTEPGPFGDSARVAEFTPRSARPGQLDQVRVSSTTDPGRPSPGQARRATPRRGPGTVATRDSDGRLGSPVSQPGPGGQAAAAHARRLSSSHESPRLRSSTPRSAGPRVMTQAGPGRASTRRNGDSADLDRQSPSREGGRPGAIGHAASSLLDSARAGSPGSQCSLRTLPLPA
jgi:hypothetical protein